jgi:PAS domain S-box-containing protein
MGHEMRQTSLNDVVITEELSHRVPRPADLKAENDALRRLARQLVEQPQTMLKTLAAIAKDLCQAGTAGVSLLETTSEGEEIFRWAAIVGVLEPYEQATTPRLSSPCHFCLERRSPQLYSHPARYFTELQGVQPAVVEGLLIPLMAAEQALGVIWILSHDPQRQFDAEDVRVMTSLADFTAAALHNTQTRQAAESAQSLLHLLLEHVPEGITIAAGPPDFPIIANSKLAQEWLGRSGQSLVGISSGYHVQSYGLFLPDGVTRPNAEELPLYRATRYGETIRDEECIIERPDGTRIRVNANVVPVRNSQGEIIGAINCWRDITEQKRIEAALRQREAKLSLVTNAVPALISFVDAEQRYRFNNRTYEEWFGHPASEVYGKTLWEVLGEAAYQIIRPYVEQALAGQQVTFESEVPYQNGGVRYISATYVPRFNPQGAVEGFVALVSDISQRKQVETALRQSEERLRIAQQAAKAGVWNWDILTNQVTWSEEYYRLYGLDPATTQPSYTNWLASILDQDRDRADQAARAALEHQTDLNVEFRVLHPTQGERWITAIGQTFYNADQQPIRMTGIALDITDRKRAEAALSQSESRYQTLVKNMPGMVYRYLPAAEGGGDHFTYVSSGCRELFELEPEAIIQDANVFWNLIHPDDFPSLQASVQAAVADSSDWQWQGRVITPSGRLKWIQGKSRLEETEQGKVWDGLMLDISEQQAALQERKQAEEALAQSEAQLRLIIESAKDYAIFTLDMGGYITHWNSGAQRLLGYQDHEILGQDGRIIFTPADLERGEAENERQKALQEGRAENERWHVRKDGSRFWGSGLVMPLRGEDNQIQGFLKILQDKTAQRQADERLHLLYEMTSDLLATEQPLTLMNALFSKLSAQLDLHCYYNFLIEERDNQRKLHLKNYSGISEQVADQLEWAELHEHICGLAAQQQQQIVLDQAQIATHPNAGFIRSTGVTAYACQPLIAQGRLLGTLSFASLTRTRFTPEEIDLLQVTCAQIAIAIERANLITSLQQQAEQLQQANRIKDEFLAVLSHELRSPLNPILGWSKLLQSRRLDEAKIAQALATIERNAKLQVELIEDLLDVSRILRGKLSLTVAPVDLASTVQAAIETMQLAAEAKSIQIQTELDASVGKILGDSARIQQVVWNLLSNAVKFTPPGGHVTVRLDTDPTAPAQQPYAQLTVSDTGKGIAPHFLPYVFDYFRQEDGATTRKFGGLGLGLAIVRHLVELHGGTISADSAGEGQGASFTVRLPLMASQPQPSLIPVETERPANLNGLKILIVDDETDTREFITFLLEQAGAHVTAVTSASEGLAALTQFKPDLLLSDIGMPELDGYWLLRQVRSLPPHQGGTIPAIALTAYAGEIDYQQAMAAGFQRHVPKPVEPDLLVRAIADLVQQIGGQANP